MVIHRKDNFIFNTADDAFRYLYDMIIINGSDTNVGTKAIYNIGFEILNPTLNEITTEWRKWSKTYAQREWDWYLSGNPSVEEIKKFAPMWDKMHNGNNIVNSNYGYQWMKNNQLNKCIEQLKKDSNSRQAWITIYDGKEKCLYDFDTPCTLSVGFDIKPETPKKLDMTVCMRSNDLIFGFCNDQYCFSKLQQMVTDELGLSVGTYYHFAHDLHIYERHYEMKSNFYKSKQ